MYFQTLDDKTECVGVYKDGVLHFEKMPDGLKRTWKYSGSVTDADIEYAWIMTQGKPLKEACPADLEKELEASVKRMNAFFKSFQIAKINLNEHCIFDLIPEDSLVKFCEIKNKVTEHVFENYERPENYDFLNEAYKMIYGIRERELNIDITDCRQMFTATNSRMGLKKIASGSKRIDYNLFGTVTGRLAAYPGSFPVLTMKKDFRKIIKPHNDWFLSLDYNGAEPRTILSLLEIPQPDEDIHEWNMENVFAKNDENKHLSRDDAKVMFFGWLYNPESTVIEGSIYDRDAVIDKFFDDGRVRTIFGREIEVDRRRALSYIVQSTTSDLVIERAIEINKFLENKKSFISHIVHDEIVVDLSNDERDIVGELKEMFSNNKLGKFMVNLSAGPNYFEMEELKL